MAKLTPQVIKTLEHHISKNDLSLFIKNFFSFIASTEKHLTDHSFKNSNFMKALNLVDSFGYDNRRIILCALCQAMQVEPLITVLFQCKFMERPDVLKLIFQLNAEDIGEAEGSFFEDFCNELLKKDNEENLKEYLPAIVQHIFDNESEGHQKLLIKKLPTNVKLSIGRIPLKMLKNLPLEEFLTIAKEMLKNPDRYNERLKDIANILVNTEIIKLDMIEDPTILISFMPYLDEKAQSKFLGKILNFIVQSKEYKKFEGFFKEAEKLELEVWQNASKYLVDVDSITPLFLKKIPKLEVEAFTRGQINNKKFFHRIFKLIIDEKVFEEQRMLLNFVNLQFFEKQDLSEISKEDWITFYKILGQHKFEKQLLISSTIHLFKEPHFNADKRAIFDSLSIDQLKQLPLEKYPLAISLLIAYVTKKLDDQKVVEFFEDIFSQITQKEKLVVSNFFGEFYKNQDKFQQDELQKYGTIGDLINKIDGM